MKKSAVILCLVLAAFCTACRAREVPAEGYQLYFVVPAEQQHGPAVITQPWQREQAPSPQQLLQALLDGPEQEGAASPFPRGVRIIRCEESEENEGLLKIVLSEQYSALTDISLTLADYCIVMTLTQLPQVDCVEIQVQGMGSGYRSHPVLRRDEVELPEVLP